MTRLSWPEWLVTYQDDLTLSHLNIKLGPTYSDFTDQDQHATTKPSCRSLDNSIQESQALFKLHPKHMDHTILCICSADSGLLHREIIPNTFQDYTVQAYSQTVTTARTAFTLQLLKRLTRSLTSNKSDLVILLGVSTALFHSCICWWRGGATVRHLGLRSVGRGFKSCSRQRCVTTLSQLFTPMCLCHQTV